MRIGDREIGNGRCCVLAEIGINHNGDLATAKRLVDAAMVAGADAVKFQKRTVDVVYSKAELDRPRDSVFGDTNGDLKRGLEFSKHEYDAIHQHCRRHGIPWLASCWDEESVDFVDKYDPPAFKVASASLTDYGLLEHTAGKGVPIILSTGMSTLSEIDGAVEILRKYGVEFVLLHCTSTYPAKTEELNLRCMQELRERYRCPVGYSGHEVGLQTSVAAVALGACIVERHLTLDRSMWGSDQAASVEPQGFIQLVRDIRTVEKALGDGKKRVYESELPIRDKLRRVMA